MHKRFGHARSVSQLNRVRASLGLSRQPVPREKKAQKACQLSQDTAKGWELAVLAAATETGLLTQLWKPCQQNDSGSSPIGRQFGCGPPETTADLAFSGSGWLHRTWDLRSYTGDGLALLTGRSGPMATATPRPFCRRWPMLVGRND